LSVGAESSHTVTPTLLRAWERRVSRKQHSRKGKGKRRGTEGKVRELKQRSVSKDNDTSMIKLPHHMQA
jgi:hypothetical protein